MLLRHFDLSNAERVSLEVALDMRPNGFQSSAELNRTMLERMDSKCQLSMGEPLVGMLSLNQPLICSDWETDGTSPYHPMEEQLKYNPRFPARKHDMHKSVHSQEVEEAEAEAEANEEEKAQKSAPLERQMVLCMERYQSVWNQMPKDAQLGSLRLYHQFRALGLVSLLHRNERKQAQAWSRCWLGKFLMSTSRPVMQVINQQEYTMMGIVESNPLSEEQGRRLEVPISVSVVPVVPLNAWSGELYGKLAEKFLQNYCMSSPQGVHELQQVIKQLDERYIMQAIKDEALFNLNNPTYVDALVNFFGSCLGSKGTLPSFRQMYGVCRANHYQYHVHKGLGSSVSHNKSSSVYDQKPSSSESIPVVISLMQHTEMSLREYWTACLQSSNRVANGVVLPSFSYEMVLAHLFQVVFAYAVMQGLHSFTHAAEDYLSAIRVKCISSSSSSSSSVLHYQWNEEHFEVPAFGAILKLTQFSNASVLDPRGKRFVARASDNPIMHTQYPFHWDLIQLGRQVKLFLETQVVQAGYSNASDPMYQAVDKMISAWISCSANLMSSSSIHLEFEQEIAAIHNTLAPKSRAAYTTVSSIQHTSIPAYQQPHFAPFRKRLSSGQGLYENPSSPHVYRYFDFVESMEDGKNVKPVDIFHFLKL